MTGRSWWASRTSHPPGSRSTTTSDKAGTTLHITAPTGLQVLSNGRLVGDDPAGTGWRTWTWDAPEPMASYLVGMAIGAFDVNAYRDGDIHYWDAIDPGLPPSVVSGSRVVPAPARSSSFLADQFGPYPFSAAGGIVDDARVGNPRTRRDRCGQRSRDDRASGDDVVVHELAHQWFGDSLAVQRWRQMRLNEGSPRMRVAVERARGVGDGTADLRFVREHPPELNVLAPHDVAGDPGPELEAIALVHAPSLTRAEREALRLVPASQLELNIGKASDCWGITGIAVAAVVVLLVVAIATLGCAAIDVKPLTDPQIAKLGPEATARQLLALRRDALDGIAH